MPINTNFFTYSLHRVNIPVTYPHIDTRQVGCSFLKLTYFPIRVKPCFLPVYCHLSHFCNKKEDFLLFEKQEILQFLSIFGLFHPFLRLSNTTVSTCVDWTRGTGLPTRDTVWKEQVYCIQNMTVQLAKTINLTCMGCALLIFFSLQEHRRQRTQNIRTDKVIT